MFILTAKVTRRRVVAGLTALILLAGLTVAGAGLVRSIQDTEVISSTLVSAKGIRTNEDRIEFLESYGWTVGTEPAAREEILIPETFDASYDEYLAMQAQQGFHLENYAGKTVKRYTYELTNYPGQERDIWVSLLVYKKTVIGGEVFSSQGDGFMHGLAYPVTQE